MFVPFLCVAVAAALPYLLSYVVLGQRISQFGSFDNRHPRLEQARLEGLGARALGASANAFETFPLFAAAVLMSAYAAVDPAVATRWAVVYVVARIAHGVCYLANWDKARSASFMVSVIALIVLYWTAISTLA